MLVGACGPRSYSRTSQCRSLVGLQPRAVAHGERTGGTLVLSLGSFCLFQCSNIFHENIYILRPKILQIFCHMRTGTINPASQRQHIHPGKKSELDKKKQRRDSVSRRLFSRADCTRTPRNAKQQRLASGMARHYACWKDGGSHKKIFVLQYFLLYRHQLQRYSR